MEIVKFPENGLVSVSKGLRNIADGIDLGEYGDAHNLAWIIDEGEGMVSFGMLGKSQSSGAEAHLLFSIAARKLEELDE